VKRFTPRPISAKLVYSLALAFLLTAQTPWAAAQRGSRAAASHPHSPTGNLALAQNAHPFALRQSSRYNSPYTSLPFSFFGDLFTPDDLYSTGYPVASQPPTFLLQAASTLAGSNFLAKPKNDRQPASSTQPLMIELQNGRYVRITSTPANGELLESSHAQTSNAQTRNAKPAITTEPRQKNLPPAVLVFRDGHTEEVRDYAIANGILYARGDYYTDGYWNKKIVLATLNVPETLQANNQRNVKFILPSSPNEVITRP
jgi:hypothetical protein